MWAKDLIKFAFLSWKETLLLWAFHIQGSILIKEYITSLNV